MKAKNTLHKEIKNAMKEVLIRLNNSNLGDEWEGILSIFMDGNGNPSVHGYIQHSSGVKNEKVSGNKIQDSEVCIVEQKIFSNKNRNIKNAFEFFIDSYKYEINELCEEVNFTEQTLDADIEKYLNEEAESNAKYNDCINETIIKPY